jgi:hypothetical protein
MHVAYKNTILQQAPNEQDTQIETATMETIAHFCAERAYPFGSFFRALLHAAAPIDESAFLLLWSQERGSDALKPRVPVCSWVQMSAVRHNVR